MKFVTMKIVKQKTVHKNLEFLMFTFIPMLFGLLACGEKDSDTAIDTENDTAVVVLQGFILEDDMLQRLRGPLKR